MTGQASNPAKTAKRAEPELTFFDSPSMDRLAQMLLVMASELHVLRDRVRCLEFMLANQGQIDADARARLAALPQPAGFAFNGPDGKPLPIRWPLNMNVFEGFDRCWGQPYKAAYACATPMRRRSTQ